MLRAVAVCALLLCIHAAGWCAPLPMNLASELIGFAPEDRVLIINADDFGMSHSTNLAVFDAFERGVLTSATVMMPTAWVKEVADWAKEHPAANIGVHLTHTSEWRRYRWAPIAGRSIVPGLVDDSGYMWPECEDVWKNATPEEAEKESRAQVDYALKLGIDVTHIDSHMGTMQLEPRFGDAYIRIAADYRLPQRQASKELYDLLGAKGRKESERAAGVLGPDVLIHGLPQPQDQTKQGEFYNQILRNLKPGITELYLHPAIDGPEMESISGSHVRRDADYRWLIDPKTRELIDELGIKLISYRQLRDAMRKAEG